MDTAIAPPKCPISSRNGLHLDTRNRCTDCGHFHCTLCGGCGYCDQNTRPDTLRQRPGLPVVTPCATP